jgi:hypothetical protein
VTTGLCDRCGSIIKRGSQLEIDRYLQSHLLLGVFPTPPIPANDHEILPRYSKTRLLLLFPRFYIFIYVMD